MPWVACPAGAAGGSHTQSKVVIAVSDVFREVDEAVREDQLKQIWRRYGKLIIAVVVLVVVCIGGWQAWQAWEASERADASDSYAAAIMDARSNRADQALTSLEGLSDPDAGDVGTLAAFAEARLHLGQGRSAEAIAIWDEIAASEGAGPTYRRAALLLSVMHQVDGGDAAALEARLQPLLAEGEPYRPLALELSALLAIKQSDPERAVGLLETLVADPAAAPGQQVRARELAAALSR